MTQYGFYFDSTRCTGCKTCMLACKDKKDLSTEIAFRKVCDYEGGNWTKGENNTYQTTAFMYHVSLACNHCENPACFGKCPTGSITKDEATGAVISGNEETCIGCGTCVEVCPYGAPTINEETKKSVKCDMCIDLVTAGKQPICVESCPLRALDFGPIDELRAAHPDAVDGIAPMPAGDLTNPSIAIELCPSAKMPGDTEGFVANEWEIATK